MENLNSIASKSKNVVALNNQTKEEIAMEKYEVVTVTEEDLINKKAMRDKYIDRLDILEKVKALFLIPEVNLMSTGMVAKFFDVPVNTIRSVYRNNQTEIDSDGAKNLKAKDIFDRSMIDHSKNVESVRGGVIVTLEDGSKFQLTSAEAVYFTPRSIMRLAMLLRDSKVAKEVRTRILDTICKPEVKKMVVKDIDDETKMLDALILDIIKNNDMTARMWSFAKYNDIQQAKIFQLTSEKQKAEDTIDVLLNGARDWGERKIVNALIRKAAVEYDRRHPDGWGYQSAIGKMWKIFYSRLGYKDGMGLKRRKADSPLNSVKEEEWPAVIRQAAALAEEYDVDIVAVIGELNAKKVS